ncbi:MAG: hypothetical protein R2725_14980 [Solirubrobacterales bacterium]
MSETVAPLSVAVAKSWAGTALAALDLAALGEVVGVYADARDAEPAWLVARLGRRRGGRIVAVPIGGCAGAPFGVWAAYEAEAMRSAPVVDPARPLRREHELTIAAHYGIGEAVGRAAAVAAREPGAVTAQPA